MFHVSTLLPFDRINPPQVPADRERARHDHARHTDVPHLSEASTSPGRVSDCTQAPHWQRMKTWLVVGNRAETWWANGLSTVALRATRPFIHRCRMSV